jgi:hypothetical protein
MSSDDPPVIATGVPIPYESDIVFRFVITEEWLEYLSTLITDRSVPVETLRSIDDMFEYKRLRKMMCTEHRPRMTSLADLYDFVTTARDARGCICCFIEAQAESAYADMKASRLRSACQRWNDLLLGEAVIDLERDEVTYSHDGNPHGLDHYIEKHIVFTERCWLFTAACGMGKSKFAPGIIAEKLGKRKIILLTERVNSTVSTLTWYRDHPPKGVGRISGRAGGKNFDFRHKDGLPLRAYTTGAFVRMKKSELALDDDTLVFLDECHNVTAESAVAMSLVKPANLVCMSATPANPGAQIDLRTPRPSTIHFSDYSNDRRFIDHVKTLPRVSVLMIMPTMRAVYRELDIMQAAFQSATFVVYSRDVKYRLVGDRKIDVNLQQLETLSKGNNIIIMSTDVLQESVTLHCSTIYDSGMRFRPNNNVNMKISGGAQPLRGYLGAIQEPIPASPSEIAQVCGRGGRTDLSADAHVFVSLSEPCLYSPEDVIVCDGELPARYAKFRKHVSARVVDEYLAGLKQLLEDKVVPDGRFFALSEHYDDVKRRRRNIYYYEDHVYRDAAKFCFPPIAANPSQTAESAVPVVGVQQPQQPTSAAESAACGIVVYPAPLVITGWNEFHLMPFCPSVIAFPGRVLAVVDDNFTSHAAESADPMIVTVREQQTEQNAVLSLPYVAPLVVLINPPTSRPSNHRRLVKKVVKEATIEFFNRFAPLPEVVLWSGPAIKSARELCKKVVFPSRCRLKRSTSTPDVLSRPLPPVSQVLPKRPMEDYDISSCPRCHRRYCCDPHISARISGATFRHLCAIGTHIYPLPLVGEPEAAEAAALAPAVAAQPVVVNRLPVHRRRVVQLEPICVRGGGRCWERLGWPMITEVEFEDPDHVSVERLLPVMHEEGLSWLPFIMLEKQEDGDWHFGFTFWCNSIVGRTESKIKQIKDAYPGILTLAEVKAELIKGGFTREVLSCIIGSDDREIYQDHVVAEVVVPGAECAAWDALDSVVRFMADYYNGLLGSFVPPAPPDLGAPVITPGLPPEIPLPHVPLPPDAALPLLPLPIDPGSIIGLPDSLLHIPISDALLLLLRPFIDAGTTVCAVAADFIANGGLFAPSLVSFMLRIAAVLCQKAGRHGNSRIYDDVHVLPPVFKVTKRPHIGALQIINYELRPHRSRLTAVPPVIAAAHKDAANFDPHETPFSARLFQEQNAVLQGFDAMVPIDVPAPISQRFLDLQAVCNEFLMRPVSGGHSHPILAAARDMFFTMMCSRISESDTVLGVGLSVTQANVMPHLAHNAAPFLTGRDKYRHTELSTPARRLVADRISCRAKIQDCSHTGANTLVAPFSCHSVHVGDVIRVCAAKGIRRAYILQHLPAVLLDERVDNYVDQDCGLHFIRRGNIISTTHIEGGSCGYNDDAAAMLSWCAPLPLLPNHHVQLESLRSFGTLHLLELRVIEGAHETHPSSWLVGQDQFVVLPLLRPDFAIDEGSRYFSLPARRFNALVSFAATLTDEKLSFVPVANKLRGQCAKITIGKDVIENRLDLSNAEFFSVVGHAILATVINSRDFKIAGSALAGEVDRFYNRNGSYLSRSKQYWYDLLTFQLHRNRRGTRSSPILDWWFGKNIDRDELAVQYGSRNTIMLMCGSGYNAVYSVKCEPPGLLPQAANCYVPLMPGLDDDDFGSNAPRAGYDSGLFDYGDLEPFINPFDRDDDEPPEWAPRALFHDRRFSGVTGRVPADFVSNLVYQPDDVNAVVAEPAAEALIDDELLFLRGVYNAIDGDVPQAAVEDPLHVVAGERLLADVIPPQRIPAQHRPAVPGLPPDDIDDQLTEAGSIDSIIERVPANFIVMDEVVPLENDDDGDAHVFLPADRNVMPRAPGAEPHAIHIPIDVDVFCDAPFEPAGEMYPMPDRRSRCARQFYRTYPTEESLDGIVEPFNISAPDRGLVQLLRRIAINRPMRYYDVVVNGALARSLYGPQPLAEEQLAMWHLAVDFANHIPLGAVVTCPSVYLDGSPGAAKSTVVRLLAAEDQIDCLVITPTRALRDDWRRQITAAGVNASVNTFFQKPRNRFDLLVVDEVLKFSLNHLIAWLSYARRQNARVILVGDSMQTNGGRAQSIQPDNPILTERLLFCGVSNTMPQDATTIVRHLHPNRARLIQTRSNIQRSLFTSLPGNNGRNFDLVMRPRTTDRLVDGTASLSISQAQGRRAVNCRLHMDYQPRVVAWLNANIGVKTVAFSRHSHAMFIDCLPQILHELVGVHELVAIPNGISGVERPRIAGALDRLPVFVEAQEERHDPILNSASVGIDDAFVSGEILSATNSSLEFSAFEPPVIVNAPTDDELQGFVYSITNFDLPADSADLLDFNLGEAEGLKRIGEPGLLVKNAVMRGKFEESHKLCDIQLSSCAWTDIRNVHERQFSNRQRWRPYKNCFGDAERLFNRFKDVYLAESADVYIFEGSDSIAQWFRTRSQSFLSLLDGPALGENASTFERRCFAKTQSKCKAGTPGFAATLPYGQGVTTNSASYSVYFADAAKKIYANLPDLLRPGVYADFGYSDEELAAVLYRDGATDAFAEFNVQFDISRQDQAHDPVLLLVFSYVASLCGVDDEVMALYLKSCEEMQVRSAAGSYEGVMSYNLASGDPFTLIRNIIHMLTVIAASYVGVENAFVLQKGDDMITNAKCDVEYPLARLASIGRVVVKIERDQAPYHAGRFFFGDRFLVDPVRAVFKHFARIYDPLVSAAELFDSFVSRARKPTAAGYEYLQIAVSRFYPSFDAEQIDVILRTFVSLYDPAFFYSSLVSPQRRPQPLNPRSDCAYIIARRLLPWLPAAHLKELRAMDVNNVAAFFRLHGIACTVVDRDLMHDPSLRGLLISPTHVRYMPPAYDLNEATLSSWLKTTGTQTSLQLHQLLPVTESAARRLSYHISRLSERLSTLTPATMSIRQAFLSSSTITRPASISKSTSRPTRSSKRYTRSTRMSPSTTSISPAFHSAVDTIRSSTSMLTARVLPPAHSSSGSSSLSKRLSPTPLRTYRSANESVSRRESKSTSTRTACASDTRVSKCAVSIPLATGNPSSPGNSSSELFSRAAALDTVRWGKSSLRSVVQSQVSKTLTKTNKLLPESNIKDVFFSQPMRLF